MSGPYDPNRLITLANSSRVPFEAACLHLNTLVSYLEDPSLEWDVLPLLRRVCLGETLDPEQTRALGHEQLLQPDGSVEPVLKAVVLAAVRGEGQLLHIDSPFTDPLDRAMADYFCAREYVRTRMEPAAAAAFFARDPLQQSFEKYRNATDTGTKWTNRGTDRQSGPSDDLPPH